MDKTTTVMYFRLPEYLRHTMQVMNDLPDEHRELQVPGASVWHVVFIGGSILSQALVEKEYTIWQHHFFIDEQVELDTASERAKYILHYLLKGSITLIDNRIKPVLLMPEWYRFLEYAPGKSYRIILNRGSYKLIHVNFNNAILRPLAKILLQHGPGQGSGVKNSTEFNIRGSVLTSSAPAGFNNQRPSPFTREVKALLNAITTSAYPEAQHRVFLDARVRDLLLIYLDNQQMQTALSTISSRNKKIIMELEQYMIGHLDQPLPVKTLAAIALMSESGLRRIFHQYYHKGIHHVLLDLRMRKAMDFILNTNIPIGRIASMVTDTSFTHFSRAFKEYFGHSPVYYRTNPPRDDEKGQ